MVAGLMILGVVGGALSATLTLVLGFPVWLAAVAYVLGGMSGMGLGMGLLLLPGATNRTARPPQEAAVGGFAIDSH